MKPIVFSTEMVQVILNGRKTQTRRVIKPQPPDWCEQFGFTALTPRGYVSGRGFSPGEKFIKLPYQTGDTLYVREKWALITDDGEEPYYEYYADTENPLPGEWPIEEKGNTILRWRPSIHMPREAARIFLKVIGVRAERVQDITPEDIATEGLPSFIIPPGHEHYKNVCGKNWLGFDWYRNLWDSLYAKGGYGWDTNPFCWVIEFKRVERKT